MNSHFFRMYFLLLSSFNFFVCGLSSAAPQIDTKASQGAVLMRYKSSFKIGVTVIIHDDPMNEKGKYTVSVIFPDGNKINLKYWGSGKFGSFFYFGPEEVKNEDVMGDYVFELWDVDGVRIDSYTDFLIPYHDESYEKIGYFDESAVVPEDGAKVKTGDCILKWNSVKGARIYEVKISRGEAYNAHNIVFRQKTEKLEMEIPSHKLDPGKYCWQLDAIREKDSDADNLARFVLGEDEHYPSFYVE